MGPGAQTARLMLYGLLAVVLMAMDHRGQYVSRARDLAQYAVEPVYHLVEWPVSALVAEIGGHLSPVPNTLRIASISGGSPAGVEVACGLM